MSHYVISYTSPEKKNNDFQKTEESDLWARIKKLVANIYSDIDNKYKLEDIDKFIAQDSSIIIQEPQLFVLFLECVQKNNAMLQTYKKNSEKIQEDFFAKNSKVARLEQQINENDKQSKKFQLKLIQSIKKLNKQIDDKDEKIKMLNNILVHKEEEINTMNKSNISHTNEQINDKDEKIKIYTDILARKQQEFNTINQKNSNLIKTLGEQINLLNKKVEQLEIQLETERECGIILEQKLNRAYQKKSQYEEVKQIWDHPHKQVVMVHKDVGKSEQIENYQSEQSFQSHKTQEMGIQTEVTELNDKLSYNTINISEITENKEAKYLQSIDRLTNELSDAYERINDLMKVDWKEDKNKDSHEKKGQKSKSNTSYFGKLFK